MFRIHFFGVRGSRSTSSLNYMKYGGNTSCIQMSVGSQFLVFDAGTGFSELGKFIKNEESIKNIKVFFSHYHQDHICGLCFFNPYFKKECTIDFYGSKHEDIDVKTMFLQKFEKPYFPITPHIFKSDINFFDIKKDDVLNFDDVKITTFEVMHPNDCLSYKVECNGKKAVFCTDTDLFEDKLQDFVDFVYGSDVLIFDGNTDEKDYMKGWGHSTRSEAINIKKLANIKKLILTHHDAEYDDDYLSDVEEQLTKNYDNIILARDNMVIDL